jgi:hypothetical protein
MIRDSPQSIRESIMDEEEERELIEALRRAVNAKNKERNRINSNNNSSNININNNSSRTFSGLLCRSH